MVCGQKVRKTFSRTNIRCRAILHDTSTYGPDTHLFRPERFLKDGALDPDIPHPSASFGFGRRICPGQSMAQSSIWLTIASVLSAFDIVKATDETGAEIEPICEYSSGLLWYAQFCQSNLMSAAHVILAVIRLLLPVSLSPARLKLQN